MKVIITGTTGMVGEGVMLRCLNHPDIDEVLSVSRRSTGLNHPKLKEYLVSDFFTLKSGDEKLDGYSACFFCAGVSSIGMNEADYTRATHNTTLTFAQALNPSAKISFVYVSGVGTDSTEKGSSMWARVKGKTENDLMKLPFKQVFAYRVGFMTPVTGQKRVLKYYKYVSWLTPLLKVIAPNMICSLEQVADSMVEATKHGYGKNVIYTKDIKILAALK